MRVSGHRGRTFINVLSTLGKELFDATNNRIYLSEAGRLPMNSLRMRGRRLFYFREQRAMRTSLIVHSAIAARVKYSAGYWVFDL